VSLFGKLDVYRGKRRRRAGRRRSAAGVADKTGVILPVYPIREAEVFTWRRALSAGPCQVPGAASKPVDAICSAHDLIDRTIAMRCDPSPGIDGGDARGRAPAEV
jgi:hypothetical protein